MSTKIIVLISNDEIKLLKLINLRVMHEHILNKFETIQIFTYTHHLWSRLKFCYFLQIFVLFIHKYSYGWSAPFTLTDQNKNIYIYVLRTQLKKNQIERERATRRFPFLFFEFKQKLDYDFHQLNAATDNPLIF